MTGPAPTVHVAVIEWSDGVEPSVIIGRDWRDVAQRAAIAVGPDGDSTEAPSDWPEVWTELPLTREVLGDAEKLQEWHNDFRDGITVPWVTFHERQLW